MHTFDYKEAPKLLLTPDIVNMLSSLHEFKGKQELYIEAESDILTSLLDIAKIQSMEKSEYAVTPFKLNEMPKINEILHFAHIDYQAFAINDCAACF